MLSWPICRTECEFICTSGGGSSAAFGVLVGVHLTSTDDTQRMFVCLVSRGQVAFAEPYKPPYMLAAEALRNNKGQWGEEEAGLRVSCASKKDRSTYG